VHQNLQVHIVDGIVADAGTSRPPKISINPRGLRMAHGRQSGTAPAPGAPGSLRLPPELPEGLWPGIRAPVASGSRCQIVSRPLDQDPASSRAARDFTRQTLHGWELRELSQDAAVIVSELVTNALRHGFRGHPNGTADGGVELILWQRSRHLVCVVTDPSSEPPVRAAPDASAEAGRGLQVIQALASTWGWSRLDAHRKAVWAALQVPGADSANLSSIV
jgi:anti-sigma regulatory factor (Ser/Thr protein kinase)